MEINCTSYKKKIEGVSFYFVKRFIIFPELDNVPPVQDGFGMHTDFGVACTIAGINDPVLKDKLWNEIESDGFSQAKVIEINSQNKKAANNW